MVYFVHPSYWVFRYLFKVIGLVKLTTCSVHDLEDLINEYIEYITICGAYICVFSRRFIEKYLLIHIV